MIPGRKTRKDTEHMDDKILNTWTGKNLYI